MLICLLEDDIICEKSIEDECLSDGFLYMVEWMGMIDFSLTFPSLYFRSLKRSQSIENRKHFK